MLKFYQMDLDTIDQSFDEIGKVLDLRCFDVMLKKEMDKLFQNKIKMMNDIRKDFDNLF